MTSLKATSTSPRRIKLLFIILLVLFHSLPLWAENFRIGVVGSDSEYGGIIRESLEIIAQVSSDDAISLVKSRLEDTAHLNYLKSREQDLKSEKLSALAESEKPVALSGTVSIEVVPLTPDAKTCAFLSSGDQDAYSYLKMTNNLDAILFIESETVGTTSSVRVLMDGTVIRTAWYVQALHDYEEKELLGYFASFFLDEKHHLYSLSITPSSAALNVDGNPAVSRYVILSDGIHTFTMDAYGYKGIREKRELTGEETELSFALEPSEVHSLYLSSRPWDASLSFNGLEMQGKYLEGIYAPYTLSATREGFSLASFQTTSDSNEVFLSLKPEWLENVDYMVDRKNEFYRSLFYTIASFGGYCGMQTLSHIYPERAAFAPLSVVFGGVSLVSLVHLVQSAADYYGTAGVGL